MRSFEDIAEEMLAELRKLSVALIGSKASAAAGGNGAGGGASGTGGGAYVPMTLPARKFFLARAEWRPFSRICTLRGNLAGASIAQASQDVDISIGGADVNGRDEWVKKLREIADAIERSENWIT